MVSTVADLITARTADALVTEQLAVLTTEEFPADSWQPGSVPRTLVLADATALAALDSTVADLARAAFLDDAEGDWLTLLAASRFRVTRVAATYTTGRFLLTVASGAGPYTIGAAGLLVTNGSLRWRSTNTASVTVTSAAPVSIEVRAESTGTAYNIAVAAPGTLSVVSPALAGLTVTNPVYASDTWITTSGADVESDASLRSRCRARWGTLGRGATDAAYEYIARTGHGVEAQVTRAQVVWGAGDGTLTVYLAGPSGAVASPAVATVAAWVDDNKPGTDNPTVTSATAIPIVLLATATVAAASDSAANRALATAALASYVASLDIGEDVDLGRLYHCFYSAAGILDVDIVQPAADVSINNGEVASLSTSITWTVV